MIWQKRGQMQAWLIGAIIVIASAVVIFWALGTFPFSGLSTKQICHNSVLMRSTSIPYLNKQPGKLIVPLKCKTERICLTKGEGCNDERITKNITVRTTQDVQKAIAGQMYDCWWMLGEGKKDFFGAIAEQLGVDFAQQNCVLCSIIKFGDDVQKDNTIGRDNTRKGTKAIDMITYLKETYVPGKECSFFDYFMGICKEKQASEQASKTATPVTTNLLVVPEATVKKGAETDVATLITAITPEEQYSKFGAEKMDTLQFTYYLDKDKEYAIFFSQVDGSTWKDLGKTLLGDVVAIGAVGAGTAYLFKGAGLLQALTLSKNVVFGTVRYLGIYVMVAQTGFNIGNQAIASAYCGTPKGCSILVLFPYTAADLETFCSDLQNIP